MPDLAPPECFTDWTVQSRLKRDWLRERGFDYLEIDLKDFRWTQGSVPSSYCLFAVKSPTPEMREKGYGHFVVGAVRERDNGVDYIVLHDPLVPDGGAPSHDYEFTAAGFFIAWDKLSAEAHLRIVLHRHGSVCA